jgi:hypothetical protein
MAEQKNVVGVIKLSDLDQPFDFVTNAFGPHGATLRFARYGIVSTAENTVTAVMHAAGLSSSFGTFDRKRENGILSPSQEDNSLVA